MSEYDAATYERFSNAVQRQVQSLRVILESLQVNFGNLLFSNACVFPHFRFSYPNTLFIKPPPPQNSLIQVDSETCVINMLVCFQAKGKERQWLKNQATGELDDAKIIDGLTGEKTIYKRRGELEPEVCVSTSVSICPCFYTDFHSCEQNSKHTFNGSHFSHISFNPILVPNITQMFDNSILSL